MTANLVDNENQCQSCGTIYPNPVRRHSGTRECHPCWDWRKFGLNAAQYWSDGIENLFSNETGSGPDMNDWALWERWGMTESMTNALFTLRAVQAAYDEMLANPRPWVKK